MNSITIRPQYASRTMQSYKMHYLRYGVKVGWLDSLAWFTLDEWNPIIALLNCLQYKSDEQVDCADPPPTVMEAV